MHYNCLPIGLYDCNIFRSYLIYIVCISLVICIYKCDNVYIRRSNQTKYLKRNRTVSEHELITWDARQQSELRRSGSLDKDRVRAARTTQWRSPGLDMRRDPTKPTVIRRRYTVPDPTRKQEGTEHGKITKFEGKCKYG